MYDKTDRYNQTTTPKLESPHNLLTNPIMTQSNCDENKIKSPKDLSSPNEVQLKLENSSPINNHQHSHTFQQQQQHHHHHHHHQQQQLHHHNRDRYNSQSGSSLNNFLASNNQTKFINSSSSSAGTGTTKMCNENGIGSNGGVGEGSGGGGGGVGSIALHGVNSGNSSANISEKEFEKIVPSSTDFSKINCKLKGFYFYFFLFQEKLCTILFLIEEYVVFSENF